MSWEVILETIRIRDFPPLTAGRKKLDRKIALKERLFVELEKDLPTIQTRTYGKPLFVDVCFYIHESDKLGKSKKDLDNLLKILFDALSENMVNGQKPIVGLGLMKDDTFIHKIICEKKSVDTDEEQGFDLLISQKK